MTNRPTKEDVRDYYNEIYHPRNLPDRLPGRNYHAFFASLRPILRPGMRILDIGCGPGFLLKTAEAHGIIPVGVDISQSALSQARSNTSKSGLVLADGEELPFQSDTFDLVVSYGSIEHFQYPEKGIRELSRVIKKDGFVRISVPNSRFWPQIFGLFRGTGQILEESHSLEEWIRMIQGSDLVIDSIQKDYGPPIFKNFQPGGIIRRILLKLSCLAPLQFNYQFIFVMKRG